jgi:hypothetical protein
MTRSYLFKLDLEVDDAMTLYHAALRHAVNVDGLSRADAVAVLSDNGEPNIEACIGMLLDPGSLSGCSIREHVVECYFAGSDE